ncbi:hypothetical protein C8Q80DRAFT_1353214 [Daedaleopsis nitida]|nr:hypothetical protein C8Q80DRAFT_1353214 [Daedaleopsis nitida]
MAPGVRPVSSVRAASPASTANYPPIAAAWPIPAKFCVGQRISVQVRTHIWIPGKVLNATYSQRYGAYVYGIEYYAADGSRQRAGFFPKDVREHSPTE